MCICGEALNHAFSTMSYESDKHNPHRTEQPVYRQAAELLEKLEDVFRAVAEDIVITIIIMIIIIIIMETRMMIMITIYIYIYTHTLNTN